MNIEKFEKKATEFINENKIYCIDTTIPDEDFVEDKSKFTVNYYSMYREKVLNFQVFGSKPINFSIRAEDWNTLFKKTLKVLKGYKE